MSYQKNLSLILPALGAAIIASLSQISIPIGPVPFTLQTLAIGLVATLFRPREAGLSALLYLILGAIGLPVFAGGSGGFQALLGPSAGFLWGFALFALVTSLLTKPQQSFIQIFLANILGDSLVFILGIVGLHFLAGMDWSKAIAVGVTPFIIPDLVKLLAVSLLAKPIYKVLKNHPYFS